MKFLHTQNTQLQILLKVIFFIIFLPIVIICLFVFVPIIMTIVCIILVLMFFTGKKLNKNFFFFKMDGKNPFKKEEPSIKNKKSDYVDAEYTSVDEGNKKKK